MYILHSIKKAIRLTIDAYNYLIDPWQDLPRSTPLLPNPIPNEEEGYSSRGACPYRVHPSARGVYCPGHRCRHWGSLVRVIQGDCHGMRGEEVRPVDDPHLIRRCYFL